VFLSYLQRALPLDPKGQKTMNEFSETHNHKANKLVKETLKKVSKKLGLPYVHVCDVFRDGNDDMAIAFWDMLYTNPIYKQIYNRVYYCQGCKKFNMYYE
jgi:hypothetical protein